MSEEALAKSFVVSLSQKNISAATAESCTGGLLASTITDVPGASNIFLGGYVVYSNKLKEKMLGIPIDFLKEHGAVSRIVAERMASSTRYRTGADMGIAVTGVAGPDSLEGKPPGTVFISVVLGDNHVCKELSLSGTREEVKTQTVRSVFSLALRLLAGQSI